MPTAPRKRLSRPFVVVCAGLGVLTVVYFALSFVALGVRQTKTTAASYAGVDRLQIDGGSGDVTLIGEQRDDVRVVARTKWGLDEPDHLQQFSDGVLKVDGGCGFWGGFGIDGCTTDFEIHVPADIPIRAEVDAGDLRASGLDGRVQLEANSGDVRVEDVSGPLTVDVDSGDVMVIGYRGRDASVGANSGDLEIRTQVVPDRIKAVTDSGDVTIAVPGGEVYDVDTETDSGDTDVQVDQSVDAPRTIEANTNSGDVRVVRLADAR